MCQRISTVLWSEECVGAGTEMPSRQQRVLIISADTQKQLAQGIVVYWLSKKLITMGRSAFFRDLQSRASNDCFEFPAEARDWFLWHNAQRGTLDHPFNILPAEPVALQGRKVLCNGHLDRKSSL